MRIKIIACPLLLAFSISVIIWFIQPQYEKYKVNRDELKARELELTELEKKNEKINNLASSLEKNSSKRVIVFRYLPEKNYEEEVINTLNNIAIGSLVSLLTMNIDLKTTASQPAFDPCTGMPLPAAAETSLVKGDLNLVGRYEKIKDFISQIYSMDRFNNISSVKISKVAAAEGGETGTAIDPELLQLGIAIDFGYMERSGVDTFPDIYSDTVGSDFDYSTADAPLLIMTLPVQFREIR